MSRGCFNCLNGSDLGAYIQKTNTNFAVHAGLRLNFADFFYEEAHECIMFDLVGQLYPFIEKLFFSSFFLVVFYKDINDQPCIFGSDHGIVE